MDEKTLQALTELASKLGTTAEYLWAALLRQALIGGISDIMLMAVWIAITVLWVKVVFRKTKEPEQSKNGYVSPEWASESAFFAWASAAILVLLTLCMITNSLSITIAAFANPEYWALKQIIK